MEIGDIVKPKIKDNRKIGRIMTINIERSSAGVLWFLREGGISCQKEPMKDLDLIRDMVRDRKNEKIS